MKRIIAIIGLYLLGALLLALVTSSMADNFTNFTRFYLEILASGLLGTVFLFSLLWCVNNAFKK